MDLVLEVLFEIDFEVKKGAAACAKRLDISTFLNQVGKQLSFRVNNVR